MECKCITISFVGVYEQPASVIPSLDADFCKNLFGMPDITISGLTPEGFVIGVNNRPSPVILISTKRVFIKADNLECLQNYTKLVKAELFKLNIEQKLSAYGINYEYQWLDLGSSAEDWMWERFLNPTLKICNRQSCPKISMRFGVNDNETINISFEPRAGRRDGLFGNINHHHNIVRQELPNPRDLATMIDQSQKLVEENFLNKIITQE